MARCTISGNPGGGLTNLASATLTDCTISGNPANGYGGGLSNESGIATLIGCTVSGNGGGGIYNYRRDFNSPGEPDRHHCGGELAHRRRSRR